MSIGEFIQDPKTYCKGRKIRFLRRLHVSNNCLTRNAGPPIANQYTAIEYTHVNAQYMTLERHHGGDNPAGRLTKVAHKVGLSSGNLKSIRVATSNVDVGFRYLPDDPGECTYMALDAAATLVITGPLQGCTVAVGKDNNNVVWIFHSYGPPAAPNAANIFKITQSIAIMEIAQHHQITNIQYCKLGEQYNGEGFAFGKKKNGVWKFYAHSVSGAMQNLVPVTTKFAQL